MPRDLPGRGFRHEQARISCNAWALVVGYDDERDQVRAAYADLRRNCHPLPEDAAGSAT